MKPLPPENPFAGPSALPFEFPPFDRIETEHYAPAFDAGMAEHRAEVEAILSDPAAPTVENTLDAFERSGALLDRVIAAFGTVLQACSTPPLRDLEADVSPRLAAHQDAIELDPRLFARVDALHDRRDTLGLTPEQRRLLDRRHAELVRAGARLGDTEQARLRDVNERISSLEAAFRRHLLEDTAELAVHVHDAAELDGLGAEGIAGAARAATERGLEGHLLLLSLPTQQPVLARLLDRDTRRRVLAASLARGARGGAHDTRETLTELAALRAERAGLLGFASHAAWVIDDETAPSVEAVVAMLAGLAPAAAANARAEAVELADALRADGVDGPLQPADWVFYAERLRGERFDIDPEAIAAWFEHDRVVIDGAFGAASALYGLSFSERTDLPAWHADVRTWEVADGDGSAIGLFVLDPFARDGKRGGAWMSRLRTQAQLIDSLPVIVNTLNVPRPSPGEPALLTPDEVRTIFHEFGHALHGLLSAVRYPSLSGVNVPADFVEFPSQVNELWAWEPESLQRYARHHRTGEPLPEGVAAKLQAAERHGQGQAMSEILAAMLLDQAWHGLAPGERIAAADVERFEHDALAAHGLDSPLVPPRYRSTYFEHIWGGGYSAGYYAYLWAEVLDADAADWFRAEGGLRRASGERFRAEVLARGNTVDPMEAYRAFRGRDPELGPLLERRGLAGAPG